MRPTPGQAIFIGGGMAALFGWIMLDLFVLHPPGNIAPDQLSIVSGRLQRAEEISTKRDYPTLQIWLEGEKIPFRCFDGPYPRYFDRAVLNAMSPGSAVTIGLEKSELAHPRRNLAQNQLFVSLVAFKVGERDALSLSSYNRWSEDNQKVARWFLPVMFCGCVYLLYSGIVAWRAGRKEV